MTVWSVLTPLYRRLSCQRQSMILFFGLKLMSFRLPFFHAKQSTGSQVMMKMKGYFKVKAFHERVMHLILMINSIELLYFWFQSFASFTLTLVVLKEYQEINWKECQQLSLFFVNYSWLRTILCQSHDMLFERENGVERDIEVRFLFQKLLSELYSKVVCRFTFNSISSFYVEFRVEIALIPCMTAWLALEKWSP